MEKQSAKINSNLETYILQNTPNRIHERYVGLVEYANTHDFGRLDDDVVVIDTETTGLSFNHDDLIQIAAARMCHGEITDWYVTFVNPGKAIPDDVIHLTHITNEMIADAPTVHDALSGLVEFVGDSYLVAHNALFDRTMCTKTEAGSSLRENIWVDSLDLARIALPRLNSHRLLDLVRAFGGPESTHRADDDVRSTCMVYRVLLAAVATMPSDLVRHIAEMTTVDEWNTCYVFKELSNPNTKPYNFIASRRAVVSGKLDPIRPDVFKPFHTPNSENDVSRETYSTEDIEEKVKSGIVSRETDNFEKNIERMVFPTEQEISEAFTPNGIVGSCYEDYEPRAEQQEMSIAVSKALSQSKNLVVEAGTGVGKSMAYLVPLALSAKYNNMTVGVATKTNALLDQLVNKELPLLSKTLGITYAPLKGFTHYPCNRKVAKLIKQGPRIVTYKGKDLDQAPALAGLISFIEQTDFDDMDALKIDFRAIPRWSISTKSSECLRRKCPFFGRACFVHGAREQAQRSDVVVTNHSLLFWDQRFEGGLLPPIRYWVVDEAHSAEAEARKAFSTNLSSESLQGLMRRLTPSDSHSNVFLRAQRTTDLVPESKALFDSLISKCIATSESFIVATEEYCLSVKDLLYFDPKNKARGYEYFDLWLNDEIRKSSTYAGVVSCAKSVVKVLDRFIAEARDVVAFFESMEINDREQRDIALLALELRELYDGFETVFTKEGINQVRSVKLCRTKDKLNDVFTVQPLDVGSGLDETFYQQTNSVVYTSATLSVDEKFEAFNRAMGLNEGEGSDSDSKCIRSSYDFDHHMRVFVPTDMPEPQDPRYLPELQKFLIDLHIAQEGSILTLFTNRKDMESSYEVVNPALKEENLRLVCQKWGVSVKGLRDDFLKDEHLSLFALKSFWEGFDAPGATLKGVVIPKLPFGLPTDPLSCERKTLDDKAWSHYSLPDAVIEVKQAVGRLIRTSTDHGFVVLADHRLISKYYGKKFLNSLPSRNVVKIPMSQIVDEVRLGLIPYQEPSFTDDYERVPYEDMGW